MRLKKNWSKIDENTTPAQQACQKQACAIQSCLNKKNHKEQFCKEHIRAYHACVQKESDLRRNQPEQQQQSELPDR